MCLIQKHINGYIKKYVFQIQTSYFWDTFLYNWFVFSVFKVYYYRTKILIWTVGKCTLHIQAYISTIGQNYLLNWLLNTQIQIQFHFCHQRHVMKQLTTRKQFGLQHSNSFNVIGKHCGWRVGSPWWQHENCRVADLLGGQSLWVR